MNAARILFVDDEPRVLEAIERMLFERRDRWDLVFCHDARQANRTLSASPVDIVVSDMRMPGEDGASLLGHVQNFYPDVVRIVLSGQMDEETALRAAPVAHRFISKPCDGEALEAMLDHICALRESLPFPDLRGLVGGLDVLPAFEPSHRALRRALEEPQVNLQEVGNLLEQDMALCAKLLQLLNSSFFGHADNAQDVREGVLHLGTDMVRRLALSLEVFRYSGQLLQIPGFAMPEIQQHSVLTARVARRILGGAEQDAQQAYVAGLLHDVGRLIMAATMPGSAGIALQAAHNHPEPLDAAERDLLGADHSDLGAYLLGLWSLPQTVVKAVAGHHRPLDTAEVEQELVNGQPGVRLAVQIADVLAQEEADQHGVQEGGPVDLAYLHDLGLGDRLDEWRALTAHQARLVAEDPHG